LSDATEIYNKLAIAEREIGLEINTSKTKLLIQTEKLEKRISRHASFEASFKEGQGSALDCCTTGENHLS
jgi:hypothetical protein